MLICIFIANIYGSEYDPFGVLYEDSSFSKLILAPPSLKNYSFPISVSSVAGGSQASSAFYQCRSSLLNVTFPKGSNLENLGDFAFCKCAFNTIIDMSNCLKLKSLSVASFMQCTSMKGIILPPNIEQIFSGALSSCSSLTSIEFPASLEVLGGYLSSIGVSSMTGCSKLTNITWPSNSSFRSFGSNCFSSCNIKELFIPRYVDTISTGAFVLCPITKITIDPLNTKYFSDKKAVFSNDGLNLVFFSYGLTDPYSIPDGVLTLNAQCFASARLSTVNISSSVKTIQYQVFWNSLITHIIIPNTVTSIDGKCFMGCYELEEIIFNPNISTVSYGMFQSCSKLAEVILPSTVKTISTSVFYSCSKIMHIFIPKSIDSIGGSCFTGIPKDCFIEFENDSKLYVENETIFNYNKSQIIAYIGSDKNFDLIVPNTVITVKSGAYKGIALSSLTFQEVSNVKQIEESAFEGCALKSLTLPPNLVLLEKNCFNSNPNLSKIDFSLSTMLNSIGESAFNGCAVKTLKLPSTVEEILKAAFKDCALLNSVSYTGSSLKKLDTNCFYGTAVENILIPSSVDYLGSQIFGESLLSVVFLSSPTTSVSDLATIGDSSFRDCVNLNSVQLAEGTKKIGRNAFEGCQSLEVIRLSESIEAISLQAFKNCLSLKKVGIPDESHLSTIEGFAFDGCSMLAEFEISEGNRVFKADEGSLYNYEVTRIILYLPGSPKKNFTVPKTIQQIDAYSFHSAANLEVVNMSGSAIQTIGNSAFYGCVRLSLVYLPKSLKRVDAMAFAECSSLRCGSIIFDYNVDLYQMLVNSEAPIESLSPCSSFFFSNANNSNDVFGFFASSLVESSICD